jgi:hypothetical protein
MQRLAAIYPFPEPENRHIWMTYLPHAECALSFRADAEDEVAERDLLFSVAASYHILGMYQEAETLYKQLLVLMEKVFGQEHSNKLHTMSSLANVLGD